MLASLCTPQLCGNDMMTDSFDLKKRSLDTESCKIANFVASSTSATDVGSSTVLLMAMRNMPLQNSAMSQALHQHACGALLALMCWQMLVGVYAGYIADSTPWTPWGPLFWCESLLVLHHACSAAQSPSAPTHAVASVAAPMHTTFLCTEMTRVQVS